MTTHRILVVGGESGIREDLARSLEILGHEVLRATTCEEAEGWCGGFGFDLMILDLSLPKIEVSAFLKSLVLSHPLLPTVLLNRSKTLSQALKSTCARTNIFIAGHSSLKRILEAVSKLLVKAPRMDATIAVLPRRSAPS